MDTNYFDEDDDWLSADYEEMYKTLQRHENDENDEVPVDQNEENEETNTDVSKIKKRTQYRPILRIVIAVMGHNLTIFYNFATSPVQTTQIFRISEFLFIPPPLGSIPRNRPIL